MAPISFAKLLLLLFCLSAATAFAANTTQPATATRPAATQKFSDLKSIQPRTALPNVGARLKYNGDVRIAFIGGSITAANAGWRTQTFEWLQAQYPRAKLTEINAAIGGTGSDLGAYRIKEQVLDNHPDLVFVEFAVNDAGADPRTIRRSMEGMVRKIWKNDPTTDIVFVYTLTDAFEQIYQGGSFPKAVIADEQVADHYGIPSIHLGLEVVQQVIDNQMVMKFPATPTPQETASLGKRKVFSNDGIHPLSDTGHKLYTDAATAALKELLNTGKAGRHRTPAPLEPDNLENAKLISPEGHLSPGWTRVPGTHPTAAPFLRFTQQLWIASTPGETVTLHFKGTAVGIYDLIGPDTDQLLVQIDDQPAHLVRRFDHFCTYRRISFTLFATDLKDAEHTLILTVPQGKQRIDKLDFLKKAGVKILDPEPYMLFNTYISRLMVLGDEIVDQPNK